MERAVRARDEAVGADGDENDDLTVASRGGCLACRSLCHGSTEGLVLNRIGVFGDDQFLFQFGDMLHQEMVIALEVPQTVEKFT